MACVHMYLYTTHIVTFDFYISKVIAPMPIIIKSTTAGTLNIKLEAGHEYEVLMCIVYCHPCQFINQVKLI